MDRRLDQLNKGYQYAYEEESIKKPSTSPIKIPPSEKGNFKHQQQRYYTEQSETINPPTKSPGKITNTLVEASETYARNRVPSFTKQTVSPSHYAYVNPNQELHFKEHSPKFGTSPSTGYGDDDPIKGKSKEEKGEPQLTIYTRSNVGKSGFGNPIDWNFEFQRILEMPEINEDQKLAKYNKLSILSKDFVSIAKRIGKIIITERSLPLECRTINPASVGGVAGGEKYVYHGILFKFAMDWMNIYGGDQYAMKAAAHELKSVIRYYGNDGIHVPLMALIDYRGWRLIAMSILPLGKDTLVYGSNDAGTTVYATLPEYNKKMEAVGRKLNLKGHLCGISTKQFLYAPCDIEGHLGTDARFYVVDYARVFPPTADEDRSAKGSFLYKLFRPEFLKKLKYPLSSDAFSHFGGPENRTEHNQENIKATQELYAFIKQYAAYLDLNSSTISIKSNITELLHREGINIRYLGLLRSSVKDTKLKQIFLSEMVARVVKNISRDKLRKKMSKLKALSLSEDPYKQVIVNFLNLILGWKGEKSKKFWFETLKTDLLKTFPNSLSQDEQSNNNFDIKTQINMYYLFLRISAKTGIKFSKQSRKEMKNNPANFNVVISDIKKVSVQVKHMNIVSISEGNALSIQSMRIEIGGDRLFRLAMSRFEEAISSTPDNQDTLNNYADVLCRVASKSSFDPDQEYQYFKTAFDKYCVANNAKSLVKLASLLTLQKLKLDQMWSKNQSQLFDLAEKCYNEAIRLNYEEKMLHDLYHHFGDLLCSKFKLTRDSKYLTLAGNKYRTAISHKTDKYGALSNSSKNFSDEELALIFEIFFSPLKNFAWEPNYVTMTTWHTLDTKHLVSTAKLDHFIHKFAINTPWNLTSLVLPGRSELTDESVIQLSKSFPSITSIDISNCTKITGESITAIAMNIKGNLKQLNISGCEGIAYEEGIFEICNLCNSLVLLDVSNTKNAVTSVKVFSLLSNLKNLETLNLAHVHIGESISTEISNVISSLVNLKSLNLSGFTNICDDDLKEISKKLGSLRELTLKNCFKIGDTGVESIMKSNTNLQIIRISGSSDITSQLFISASKYSSNLQELNVHRCYDISSVDNSFELFNKSCQNLQILDVSGTSIDSSLLSQLKPKTPMSSPKIKYLDLSSTKVSDDGIRLLVNHYITNSYGLTWLSLANCVGITDKSLEYISHSVVTHTLQYLSLHGLQNITDNGISALLSKPLESLLELDLTRCNNLTADSFRLVATRCKRLKELKLKECRIVNDTIKEISENLHWLKVLDLRECLLISTFGDLPSGCPYLETLLLDGCEHVSDIENIAQYSALKRLNLYKCKRVTDLTIKLIEEGCPSLQVLEIGTNKTSDTAIELLRSSRPDINVIIQSNLIHSSSGNIAVESTPKTVKSAMRSLMYDLKQIETHPLPLVSAYPLEGDMFIWHGNLVGPENTPYAGGIFHIELKFPRTYPQDSPSATILCPLPHPHVTNGKICLDLLSDYSSYFQTMDAQNKGGEKSTGWSSAYSVQTLLLQLQAFLMELDDTHGPIDQYLSQIPDAIKYSKTFECKTCSHKPGNPWPSIISTQDTTSIGKISELDLIRQELVCYHTRVSFTEDILGLGISVERNPKGLIKNISSPLELLSQTAFKEGVRKSIMNDMDFSYWLPVYINPEHYKRAASAIRTSISKIATGGENNFTPELAVEVLTKLMNTMIVNIMSGQLHASIKCLQGYCYFQRLLLHFAKEYPTILTSANKKVNDFILNESLRHKKVVPALGEFLPLLLLSEKRWRDIGQYYLRETFDRNVYWILQKHPELGKYDYDKDIDPSRNQKTFLATQVSLKLLLFHVYFLERVARPAGFTLEIIASNYDKLLGHPSNTVKEELQAAVKDILQLESWEEFFRRIGVSVPSDLDLNMWLRRSVFNSLKRGYHGSEAFKKKETCKTFAATGYCKYGKNCKFAH